MEVREKLGSISAGTMYSTIWIAVICEGFAMLGVCYELKTRCVKFNFASFNFAVQPQPRKPRKFVDHENFPSYGICKQITNNTIHQSMRKSAKLKAHGS